MRLAVMIPDWLHILSIVGLLAGIVCAAIVLADVVRHPQHMAIMNLVWPITALFGTVLTLWLYLTYGRLATQERMHAAKQRGASPPSRGETPFWAVVAKGASHCGAGCTLGDIVAEWLCFLVPAVAVWFGWQSVFGEKMFAVWIADFLIAYAFGVAFQYFAIRPMRDISAGKALWLAIKADTLSLTSWQIGMYGFMAFAQFYWFRQVFGVSLRTNSVEFWFVMQIAMLCGFATAFPVNWWLIRSGIKEKM